jgi:hypothetical protein
MITIREKSKLICTILTDFFNILLPFDRKYLDLLWVYNPQVSFQQAYDILPPAEELKTKLISPIKLHYYYAVQTQQTEQDPFEFYSLVGQSFDSHHHLAHA